MNTWHPNYLLHPPTVIYWHVDHSEWTIPPHPPMRTITTR